MPALSSPICENASSGRAWTAARASRRGTCPGDRARLRAPCARFPPRATSSPAFGAPDRPSTTTGMDGGASCTDLPVSSNMARTRPNSEPAMIGSPISQRALLDEHRRHGAAALLDARLDDDARGEAGARRLAAPALRPAAGWLRAAGRCPAPVRAETFTKMFWPPHSSGMTSCLDSSVRTRSGSASLLSILLTATTIGTSGRLARAGPLRWSAASRRRPPRPPARRRPSPSRRAHAWP